MYQEVPVLDRNPVLRLLLLYRDFPGGFQISGDRKEISASPWSQLAGSASSKFPKKILPAYTGRIDSKHFEALTAPLSHILLQNISLRFSLSEDQVQS